MIRKRVIAPAATETNDTPATGNRSGRLGILSAAGERFVVKAVVRRSGTSTQPIAFVAHDILSLLGRQFQGPSFLSGEDLLSMTPVVPLRADEDLLSMTPVVPLFVQPVTLAHVRPLAVFQRAFPPLRPIAESIFRGTFFARAKPPSRPRATAARFFFFSMVTAYR